MFIMSEILIFRGVEYSSISKAAKAHDMCPKVTCGRLRSGYSIEVALGLEPLVARVTYKGKNYSSVYQIAKEHGFDQEGQRRVADRVSRCGWDLVEALKETGNVRDARLKDSIEHRLNKPQRTIQLNSIPIIFEGNVYPSLKHMFFSVVSKEDMTSAIEKKIRNLMRRLSLNRAGKYKVQISDFPTVFKTPSPVDCAEAIIAFYNLNENYDLATYFYAATSNLRFLKELGFSHSKFIDYALNNEDKANMKIGSQLAQYSR